MDFKQIKTTLVSLDTIFLWNHKYVSPLILYHLLQNQISLDTQVKICIRKEIKKLSSLFTATTGTRWITIGNQSLQRILSLNIPVSISASHLFTFLPLPMSAMPCHPLRSASWSFFMHYVFTKDWMLCSPREHYILSASKEAQICLCVWPNCFLHMPFMFLSIQLSVLILILSPSPSSSPSLFSLPLLIHQPLKIMIMFFNPYVTEKH